MSGALYGMSLEAARKIAASAWCASHKIGIEDLHTGLMVEKVMPGARYYHLECLYTADMACPARHRQIAPARAVRRLPSSQLSARGQGRPPAHLRSGTFLCLAVRRRRGRRRPG